MASGKAVTWEAGTTAGDGRGSLGIHAMGGWQEVIMEKLDVVHPLITRDPVTGGELIATRLECPESGIIIEGKFSLGWMARLNPEQLAFVWLLVKHRGNIQKLTVELNIAYTTARNHLNDIVDRKSVV